MTNRIEKLLEGITPAPWKYINDVVISTPTENGVYANEKDMALMEAAPTIIRELHEHAQAMREALSSMVGWEQVSRDLHLKYGNPYLNKSLEKGEAVLAAYDAWMKGE